MSKKIERALLLCVKKYSLYNSFLNTLRVMANDVRGFDVKEKLGAIDLRVNAQLYRFPYKIRNRWEMRLLEKANRILLDEVNAFRPDLIVIYNSEFLLPATCAKMKKDSRLVFFMGDSPFYTPQNNYYLACLPHADLILSPDSFWSEQLNMLGIHGTAFFAPGIDLTSYHILPEQDNLRDVDERDVLYTGTSYVNSWGYKKALLMSQFIRFNFRLYGNVMWRRWFPFFPELENAFEESGHIPTERLNRMFNRSKLIPVDGNPGILNGFHLRLFEALGAGALPLVEYRKDVPELLFKGCPAKVPLIRDYGKAGDLAAYYLKNEKERSGLALALRDFILQRYAVERNAEYLLELLQDRAEPR